MFLIKLINKRQTLNGNAFSFEKTEMIVIANKYERRAGVSCYDNIVYTSSSSSTHSMVNICWITLKIISKGIFTEFEVNNLY